MEKYCQKMYKIIWNEETCLAIMKKACKIIDKSYNSQKRNYSIRRIIQLEEFTADLITQAQLVKK